MLRRVSVSSVSRLAAINGSAAFLAPPMVILPARGRLPRMRILSIEEGPWAALGGSPPQPNPISKQMWQKSSELRQCHAALTHIFAGAVGIGGLAGLLAAKEEKLADPLAGIDLGRQRRRVRDLDGDMAFPFRLERRHVDDDAAARIGRFAETDDENVARHAEILDRRRQRETVRRHDADIELAINEARRQKRLGIDDGAVDIGKDLELAAHPRIVAIGREPVGDHPFAGLLFDEGLDHAMLLRHFADPFIRQDRHVGVNLRIEAALPRCNGSAGSAQVSPLSSAEAARSLVSRWRTCCLRFLRLSRSAAASRAWRRAASRLPCSLRTGCGRRFGVMAAGWEASPRASSRLLPIEPFAAAPAFAAGWRHGRADHQLRRVLAALSA